jgi:TPR repeat protein
MTTLALLLIDQSNFEKAIPLLLKAAELGNPEAHYHSGMLLKEGEHIPPDLARAASHIIECNETPSGFCRSRSLIIIILSQSSFAYRNQMRKESPKSTSLHAL